MLRALVFSATQLMSIAIILRTKEAGVGGCKLEGRLKGGAARATAERHDCGKNS
jgi:hypothetical protein